MIADASLKRDLLIAIRGMQRTLSTLQAEAEVGDLRSCSYRIKTLYQDLMTLRHMLRQKDGGDAARENER